MVGECVSEGEGGGGGGVSRLPRSKGVHRRRAAAGGGAANAGGAARAGGIPGWRPTKVAGRRRAAGARGTVCSAGGEPATRRPERGAAWRALPPSLLTDGEGGPAGNRGRPPLRPAAHRELSPPPRPPPRGRPQQMEAGGSGRKRSGRGVWARRGRAAPPGGRPPRRTGLRLGVRAPKKGGAAALAGSAHPSLADKTQQSSVGGCGVGLKAPLPPRGVGARGGRWRGTQPPPWTVYRCTWPPQSACISDLQQCPDTYASAGRRPRAVGVRPSNGGAAPYDRAVGEGGRWRKSRGGARATDLLQTRGVCVWGPPSRWAQQHVVRGVGIELS